MIGVDGEFASRFDQHTFNRGLVGVALLQCVADPAQEHRDLLDASNLAQAIEDQKGGAARRIEEVPVLVRLVA
ncbi:hypothetical protein Ate01nite_16770 [Actinoplanes teichomyceticus]|nr:hypothetical protein Ate01nite_16770 [Actinoplanes teichomyceticus]